MQDTSNKKDSINNNNNSSMDNTSTLISSNIFSSLLSFYSSNTNFSSPLFHSFNYEEDYLYPLLNDEPSDDEFENLKAIWRVRE